MSCFDVRDNDLDMILIKYTNLYLRELTYYGTSKTEQMFLLLGVGQELNALEKKIINDYYEYYLLNYVFNNMEGPNMYYLQKIFYTTINLIIQMTMLWIESNKKNNDLEELQYKLRYLIGSLESWVEKFVEPIESESKLEFMINSNNIFKLNYPILYLKKFLSLNKNKFISCENIKILNKLIELLEKNNKH